MKHITSPRAPTGRASLATRSTEARLATPAAGARLAILAAGARFAILAAGARFAILAAGALVVSLAGWMGCGGGDGSNDPAADAALDSDSSFADARDDGPPADSLAECGQLAGGTNMEVCTSSYLAGPGDDWLSSVAIGEDHTLYLAGTLAGSDLDAEALPLAGGGSGAIIRLTETGSQVLSVTRIGDAVLDMAVMPPPASSAGSIVVSSENVGVAMLNRDATDIVWQRDLFGASRVAAGSDGSVAALIEQTVVVLDGADGGAELGRIELADDHVKDIAAHGPTGSIIVTGFNQVSGNLQQPFLRSYTHHGDLRWVNYDWSSEQASGSDTRAMAVAIGRDGALYYAGESHGGQTTHHKDPRDLDTDAPNVSYDEHNTPYDWNGSAPLGYFARFDADTGIIEQGQFIVPRLSSGKGNGSSPTRITADSAGNVLVAGSSACCIADYESKTVNSVPAMPTYGGGAFVLVVTADFSQRLAWTAWNAEASAVDIVDVAASSSSMAIGGVHGPDEDTGGVEGRVVTTQALQLEPPGGESDGFFALWPAP
jgi:hypothetical protein